MYRVLEVRPETASAFTVMLAGEVSFEPGQFVMAWIPRLDEKPFTISYRGDDGFGITVLEKGQFTKRLRELQPGDWLGIRGPYGRAFTLRYDSIAVGGGCGMAALASLAERLPDLVLIQGARTADEILYRERFPSMTLCTDDGSAGREGFPTVVLEEMLISRSPDMVYTCGPEVMMVGVVDICRRHDVPCQASLERFMKCGFGVCGQCTCSGQRVCKDGPIFDGEQLAEMPDFGRFGLLKTGERAPLEVCAAWRGGGK